MSTHEQKASRAETIRAVERADALTELSVATMHIAEEPRELWDIPGCPTCPTIEAVKRLRNERDKMAAVCDQILDIMETYHEQDASPRGVDTPGGLEHMGDVWRLFRKWETSLKASDSESKVGGGGGFSSKPSSAEKQPNAPDQRQRAKDSHGN